MDKNTVLNLINLWSPEFSKGCFSAHEDNICLSAGCFVLSALMLLVSCLLLIYHRCKTRCRTLGDEAACSFYCVVGSLCSAVGAFLSNQFVFQVSMASYAAILDIIHILSITCSVYLWYHSKAGKTTRMISKRRRQNFLVVSLMFVMGGVYLNSAMQLSPVALSSTRRKLLSLFLHNHTENLGYVLGVLSFAIGWTARFPFFLKANRGEQGSGLQVWSRVLCALAGGLYASSILFYDLQSRTFVKAMPWILAAVCCAVMDLAIVALICYRSRHKRSSIRSVTSETESLLGDSIAAQLCNNNTECHRKKRSIPLARCIPPKRTDMGLYMDVNIQPMRKVCLKEVTISRDCSSDAVPLKRTVRVVRVDEPCSSSTSTDSSSLSSELQWDFEEPKPQWTSAEAAPEHLQNVETFPLQEWQVGPGSKSNSRPGSHVCLCTQLAEKLVSKKSDG